MTAGQVRLQTPNDAMRLLDRLVGHRLEAVRYLMLFYGLGLPEEPSEHLEQVDYAVELTINGHPLMLRWRAEDDVEVLVITDNEIEEREWSSRVIDVTDRRGWLSRIGGEIKSFSISTQVFGAGNDEYLWAVRFNFSAEPSVVIALGELEDGNPSYLPTSLLVLFDENLAQNYLTD